MKAFYSLHDKYQCDYTKMVMMIISYIPQEDKIVNGYNIKKTLTDRLM